MLPSPAPAGTILVVEDELDIGEAYRAFLESVGYNALLARNGVEAIRIAIRHRPDLVLLDLLMPHRNGFAVLRELRRRELIDSTTVVVVSNLGQPADIERCYKLGAKGYAIKSDLSLDALHEMVRKHLPATPRSSETA